MLAVIRNGIGKTGGLYSHWEGNGRLGFVKDRRGWKVQKLYTTAKLPYPHPHPPPRPRQFTIPVNTTTNIFYSHVHISFSHLDIWVKSRKNSTRWCFFFCLFFRADIFFSLGHFVSCRVTVSALVLFTGDMCIPTSAPSHFVSAAVWSGSSMW